MHGVAAYAEPASNACIAVVSSVFSDTFITNLAEHPRVQLVSNWIALVLTTLLAVLIKRENLLLAIGLLLTAVIYMVYRADMLCASKTRLWSAVVGVVIVIVLSSTELAPANTLMSEAREFGGFPFSVSNLTILAPIYLRAFVSLSWYSCSFLFVIVGFWVAI